MNTDPDILRKEFLDSLRSYVTYWTHQKGYTCKQKMEGLVHSILCVIDGVSSQLDGYIDLVVRVSLDDHGEKEQEVLINGDCYLHDEWHEK